MTRRRAHDLQTTDSGGRRSLHLGRHLDLHLDLDLAKRGFSWATAVLVTVLSVGGETAFAALPDAGRKDVTFAAEHLLESDMDARYSALPLAGGALEPGAWQSTVLLSAVDTGAGLYRLRGPGLSVGLARGLSRHWSLQALGFFERSNIGGDDRNALLRPEFTRDIPLDLPERADFQDASGDVEHWAAGLAITRQTHRDGAHDGLWTWSLGVLRERFAATDSTVRYRLTGGADAGASGVLDLSATYSFVTPIMDLRFSRRLGRSWRIEPHATLALPLPSRGFAGRISGPGFDVAGDTETADHGVHMGDPALVPGLGLEHVHSHVSIEIGAPALQTFYEEAVHAGVDHAWSIQLRWHG